MKFFHISFLSLQFIYMKTFLLLLAAPNFGQSLSLWGFVVVVTFISFYPLVVGVSSIHICNVLIKRVGRGYHRIIICFLNLNLNFNYTHSQTKYNPSKRETSDHYSFETDQIAINWNFPSI